MKIRKHNINITALSKSTAYILISSVVPIMSFIFMFFPVLDPVQAHALHSVVTCLLLFGFCFVLCFYSFDLEQFLRLPFCSLTLIFLWTGQSFCGRSLDWVHLIFSQDEAHASHSRQEIPREFSCVPLRASYQGARNGDQSCRWSHLLWWWCLLDVFIIKLFFPFVMSQ